MVGTIPRGLVIIIDHDRSRENEELMFILSLDLVF